MVAYEHSIACVSYCTVFRIISTTTFTRHAVSLQCQSLGTVAGVAATGVGAEPTRVAIVSCVCLAFVDIYIAV